MSNRDLPPPGPAAMASLLRQLQDDIEALKRRPTGAGFVEVPIGGMIEFGGAAAPENWLLTDGAIYQVADFPDLAEQLGTRYGGDGITTFGVPDSRDRFIVGAGLSYALGALGGAATVVLATNQMPSHSHGGATQSTTPGVTGGPSVNATDTVGTALPNAGTAGTVSNPGSLLIGAQWGTAISAGVTAYNGAQTQHAHTLSNHTHTSAAHTHPITAEGGGLAHENRPPYLAVNRIIRAR